ncbi:hypothetical protein IWW38_001261, partial [Coemansia aciculifera]
MVLLNNTVYPSLQSLSIFFDKRTQNNVKSTSKDYVPFPVLKRLSIGSSYPFAEDVVFRGNSGTLEKLSITLDKDLVDILNNERVFENPNKVLRTVTVKLSKNFNGINMVPDDDISRFFCNLTSAARFVSLPKFPAARIAASPAELYQHGFNHVQVLHVQPDGLTFYHMLCLLKLLPALVKLD